MWGSPEGFFNQVTKAGFAGMKGIQQVENGGERTFQEWVMGNTTLDRNKVAWWWDMGGQRGGGKWMG